jgi:hypothetical protein
MILTGGELVGEGEVTSDRVASKASRLMRHKDPRVRSVAGSALTQARARKR